MTFANDLGLEELTSSELEIVDGGMIYEVAGALAGVFCAGFLVGQAIVAAFN